MVEVICFGIITLLAVVLCSIRLGERRFSMSPAKIISF